MSIVPRRVYRARWAVGAAALALAATGCAPDSDASAEESPSPSGSASSPGWSAVGGEAVTGPSLSPSASQSEIEERRVDALPLPASCEATGIEQDASRVLGQLESPEFTEVRTDTRLECSWAGFDPDEGSEVVMVTFAPEKSLVAYPGHVPVKAQRRDDFFTTGAVASMGGIAQWDTGEMFSGVKLHLPGMLISTTSNTPRVATGDLLRAVTATAQELTGGTAQQGAAEPAPPTPAPEPTVQADADSTAEPRD
ncbi:hypothetical protein [Streptomonospora halophila]|uniref:hypothetical protein n=1 Tax=Streptomonospora halophila TaxID=427369 RepID=UPI0031EE8A33